MAATADPGSAGDAGLHQRVKHSVLRSFIGHKRAGSDGVGLSGADSLLGSPYQLATPIGIDTPTHSSGLPKAPQPLGELQQNHQVQAPRSPKKLRSERVLRTPSDIPKSPEKRGFTTMSLKSLAATDSAKPSKTKENGPPSPKKTKSSTSLVGLLSRPKSSKNLKKLAEEEAVRAVKDKENRTPPASYTGELDPPTPIYAQFCSQPYGLQPSAPSTPVPNTSHHCLAPQPVKAWGEDSFPDKPALKQRPKSFQPPYVARKESAADLAAAATPTEPRKGRPLSWVKGSKDSRSNLLAAFSGLGNSAPRNEASAPGEDSIDPKDIDKHLEAMLDRRNIPENQRYKMRNLTATIKMEFIRQDWAEAAAKATSADDSNASVNGREMKSFKEHAKDHESGKSHSRGRSFTLSRAKSPGPRAKSAKGESTIGRHFRSRSTDSISSDRPSSSSSSSGAGRPAKGKGQLLPGDFVQYLQTVQKPELVEVGKLHKLRLLLRNETVAWAEDFIRQGGMKEVVGLLNRTMEMEWREEHEDALLHENLLCLKALCTTALALQYLHSIQANLFPALLHMIFDPEKKGPSDFTTRGIITSVLLTYIQSAAPRDRGSRAMTVLGYLRDSEGKEEERPVSFVLEMRRERPYKVWCKEVVGVTKEVFWIFLHGLNIVPLPASDKGGKREGSSAIGRGLSEAAVNPTMLSAAETDMAFSYMLRHFPQERPPVPAAPYVGGVEWDATNYLASHLDLLNAIVACLPSVAARSELREQLRVSGWERVMGVSLRTCKAKFYGAVHDGLATWVAAAAEDGWDVRDVRYGPPPPATTGEAHSSPMKKKRGGGADGARKDGKSGGDVAPPKIEMPKLDLAFG